MQRTPYQPPILPTIQFQEIPIGQHFEFRGRRYQKLALNMANDEERNGTIFMPQTEVLPDPLAHLDVAHEVIILQVNPGQ
jgi:hypothetical protein